MRIGTWLVRAYGNAIVIIPTQLLQDTFGFDLLFSHGTKISFILLMLNFPFFRILSCRCIESSECRRSRSKTMDLLFWLSNGMISIPRRRECRCLACLSFSLLCPNDWFRRSVLSRVVASHSIALVIYCIPPAFADPKASLVVDFEWVSFRSNSDWLASSDSWRQKVHQVDWS